MFPINTQLKQKKAKAHKLEPNVHFLSTCSFLYWSCIWFIYDQLNYVEILARKITDRDWGGFVKMEREYENIFSTYSWVKQETGQSTLAKTNCFFPLNAILSYWCWILLHPRSLFSPTLSLSPYYNSPPPPHLKRGCHYKWTKGVHLFSHLFVFYIHIDYSN